MKQISTGAGLLGLGVCLVATAFIASQRGGSEAFAQGTGTERRIVSAGIQVVPSPTQSSSTEAKSVVHAYRIWSDNAIDMRCLGVSSIYLGSGQFEANLSTPWGGNYLNWKTVDNGTSGFRPLTDVDMSGETDAGDISMVLLDMNTTSEDFPPPPIDCNINAPQ